jgi:hypothetical protein
VDRGIAKKARIVTEKADFLETARLAPRKEDQDGLQGMIDEGCEMHGTLIEVIHGLDAGAIDRSALNQWVGHATRIETRFKVAVYQAHKRQ